MRQTYSQLHWSDLAQSRCFLSAVAASSHRRVLYKLLSFLYNGPITGAYTAAPLIAYILETTQVWLQD